MRSTLVGVFENRFDANHARDELLRAGFADDDVSVRDQARDDADGALRADDDAARRARAADAASEGGFGDTVADWFRSLLGIDDDDFGVYSEAQRRGNSVVTVSAADDDRVERATDILEECGSIDIDERAYQWQSQGWARPSPTPGGVDSPAPAAPASAPLGSTASSAAAMGAASPRRAGDAVGSTGVPDGAAGAPRTGTGTGTPSTTELQSGEKRTIPAREEERHAGKRIVGRRGVRVYTQVGPNSDSDSDPAAPDAEPGPDRLH